MSLKKWPNWQKIAQSRHPVTITNLLSFSAGHIFPALVRSQWIELSTPFHRQEILSVLHHSCRLSPYTQTLNLTEKLAMGQRLLTYQDRHWRKKKLTLSPDDHGFWFDQWSACKVCPTPAFRRWCHRCDESLQSWKFDSQSMNLSSIVYRGLPSRSHPQLLERTY